VRWRLHGSISSLEQLLTFLDGSPPSDMVIPPNEHQLNPVQAAETRKISATPLVALDGSPLSIVTIEDGMLHPPTPHYTPAHVAPGAVPPLVPFLSPRRNQAMPSTPPVPHLLPPSLLEGPRAPPVRFGPHNLKVVALAKMFTEVLG
jgi:hypothetical protein